MLGLAAATLAGFAEGASAMTYSIASLQDRRCAAAGTCRQAIVARGEIQVDEPERLRAFLQQLGSGETAPTNVLIHSPGGNVRGALALGFELRRIGARVIVASVNPRAGGAQALGAGSCASACAFVLMGGRDRVVPQGSRVLVHQPRRVDAARSPVDPRISELLQSYARAMGVDPGLIALADRVPHESAYKLSPTEIRRFRLTTGQ
jgi:hypothetical protein